MTYAKYILTVYLLMALPMAVSLASADTVSGPSIKDRPLTKEEFACELIGQLRIRHLLPKAALAKDCIAALEQLGVSPLAGWGNGKEYLNEEDYFVLLGKARGKEGIVHQRAVQVEQKNIKIINELWQKAYDDTGRWPLLTELLNDTYYFPEGQPKSPYGLIYRDRNRDHKIDPLFLPIAKVIELRERLAR